MPTGPRVGTPGGTVDPDSRLLLLLSEIERLGKKEHVTVRKVG